MNQLINNTLSVQRLIEVYRTCVLPVSTKRSKAIGIGVAISFSLFYLAYDSLLRPPKRLRHIPYVSYFSIIGSILCKESLRDYDRRVIVPMVNNKNTDGIYMQPLNNDWVIVVTDIKHAKTVFLKTDIFPKAPQDKGMQDTALGRFMGGPSILFLNGHEWKSQRKLASPAFHRSMPVKLFGHLTLDLFKIIDQHHGPINFSDLIKRYTLDVIGRAGFGFDFNAINERNNDWVKTYNAINDGFASPIYFLVPILDRYNSFWLTPGRREVHRHLDRFFDMIDQIILKKREAIQNGEEHNTFLPESEKDILTLMIEGEMRGEGVMSNEELKNNVCIFLLAGHETTASIIGFLMYYLAIHPDIQQRARNEAMQVLGTKSSDILPTLEQTKKLAYINQVMKEALRINGPAVRVIDRIAAQDLYLGNTFIPRGSKVNVDIANIHHNEKFWKDSDVFDPDRFSEDGEASTHKGVSGLTWLPFGSGARQCIGMNFGLYEQRVFLSMILRKYTWKLPEDSIHRHGVIQDGASTIGPVNLDLEFTKLY